MSAGPKRTAEFYSGAEMRLMLDLVSDAHQSFLLEPLSEDSVLWKDVTQQEVVLLLLCESKKEDEL